MRLKLPLLLILSLLIFTARFTDLYAVSIGPDLAITSIGLNQEGKLTVEAVNLGPGPLRSPSTSKSLPFLDVYRNGKHWGSLTLNQFDPKNRLSSVGGKINFVLNNLYLNETELIRVVIDAHNKTGDLNRGNNSFQKRLAITLPDLTVSDIYLTNHDRLAIEITNNGSGAVHKKYWEHSRVSLYLYQDGKPWGGISLKMCDPSQKLYYPKGQALYILNNIRINQTTEIQVVIDPQNTVRESNEANNSLRKTVTCANPDLAITNLWVVNGNWLAVQIINKGPKSIALKYWEEDLVYFELFRNGKNQGRVPLKAIDPHRNLAKPNGKAVYLSSSFRISGSEEIRAVIDSQNIIKEADEKNNSLKKILTVQNRVGGS